MPADRLLGTLLRALQTYTDQQDTPRLFGTTASLLTTLNNPLNVTLLTSQLLSAPAIWVRPEGLRTSMRCLSVFHSATQALLKHEEVVRNEIPDEDFAKLQWERTLPKDDWIKATISGADEHSPRWRHLLVIAGLLLGFGPREDRHLSRSMRSTVEAALVTAANLALEETIEDDDMGLATITLVLNHCFPHLSDYERAKIDYDSLLPFLMRATLHSSEGLGSGYFLGTLDRDVQVLADSRLQWSERSPSYQQIQAMLQGPLVSSLGSLSRLIGHAIEQVQDPGLVAAVVDGLSGFARVLLAQWRQNKLSGIEFMEQQEQLEDMTFKITTPLLWKLLQSILFASVIVLRSALGRLLGDSHLSSDTVAPKMAKQSLNILRCLYFISTRQGSATFSQYSFVCFTAMDILGAYPSEVQNFLGDTRPMQLGAVAQHPLDRCLDLFFLNTAEHFTLVLPTDVTDELLVPSITSYLSAGGKGPLLPIFEAAHSVTLAIFSAPQNAEATLQNLPFYVQQLFRVFPSNLSARQFRLAFKTLLKITSPPSPLSLVEPMMPATLLELLHERSYHASSTPIAINPESAEAAIENPVPLSEQAVLTLTVIDGLTQIPLDLLDEWLPITADMIHNVQDTDMREHCKEHFWHCLVGTGEMDPERSRVCHAWWSTAGGKEWVLYGREDAVMSGGVMEDRESKL